MIIFFCNAFILHFDIFIMSYKLLYSPFQMFFFYHLLQCLTLQLIMQKTKEGVELYFT